MASLDEIKNALDKIMTAVTLIAFIVTLFLWVGLVCSGFCFMVCP